MCLEDVAIHAKQRVKVVTCPTGVAVPLNGGRGGPTLCRIVVFTALGDFSVAGVAEDGTDMGIPYRSYNDGSGGLVKVFDTDLLLPLNLNVRITFLGGFGSGQAVCYYLDPVHYNKAMGK